MDAIAQLALMTKAKLVFEEPGTFLCFPATTPLNYSAGQLNFAQIASASTMTVFSEFSRLTNSLPQGVIFQPELDVLLWDVYQGMLQNAQIAQGDLSPQQKSDLQRATAFLYTQGPQGTQSDSPALISYKQHEQAWLSATQNYKVQQITATTSSNPALQAQWLNTNEPLARAQVQAAESAWETNGFKAQVEQAQQVEQTIAGLSPQLKWQYWIAHCNPDIDFLTDPNNQTFGPTFYSPSDIIDQAMWPAFTIHASEIPQLISQAPKELTDLFGTTSEASAIDSLSFEFCSVVLGRAWFQAMAFEERFWRFADPSIQLSDGNNPPKGEWPAYITGLVLARNIVETSHVNTGSVQHQPIKFFPPILLRANPAPIVRPFKSAILTRPISASESHLEVKPAFALSAREVTSPLLASQRAPVPAAPKFVVPRNVSFISLPPADLQTKTAPTNQITTVPTSSSAGVTASGSQLSAAAQNISILAFICKQLKKCPNPDPGLDWG
jgi:hypothetical protein